MVIQGLESVIGQQNNGWLLYHNLGYKLVEVEVSWGYKLAYRHLMRGSTYGRFECNGKGQKLDLEWKWRCYEQWLSNYTKASALLLTVQCPAINLASKLFTGVTRCLPCLSTPHSNHLHLWLSCLACLYIHAIPLWNPLFLACFGVKNSLAVGILTTLFLHFVHWRGG